MIDIPVGIWKYIKEFKEEIEEWNQMVETTNPDIIEMDQNPKTDPISTDVKQIRLVLSDIYDFLQD